MARFGEVKKLCTGRCKLLKPLSDFYHRSGHPIHTTNPADYLSQCKACMIENGSSHAERPAYEPGSLGQYYVAEYLSRNNIPNCMARALNRGAEADIIAWGCLTIATQVAVLSPKNDFRFHFGPSEYKRAQKARLIILVCDYHDYQEFHIFDGSISEIYNQQGNLRRDMYFRPIRYLLPHSGEYTRRMVTQSIMNKSHNRLDFIGDALVEWKEAQPDALKRKPNMGRGPIGWNLIKNGVDLDKLGT